MWILYILFTLLCCYITARSIESHVVKTLKTRDEQNLELIDKLSDYICANKKQIQDNVRITNQLVDKVFNIK